MPRLVDTHCHLQHPAFDADRDVVLDRALGELDWLVVIGDEAASSEAAVTMAVASNMAGRIFAAAGIHPHNAAKATRESLERVRRLLNVPGVVALGEIGLDYHYEFSPRDDQRGLLRAQLEMAVESAKPVVIHCREAESDLAELIEPAVRDLAGGVMHCFGGDGGFAQRCVEWGFYVSFAGNVTFPKAGVLQDAAAAVPLERLLVETDSPYLAPQPVRGKRCEPVHVLYTARFLADMKGISLDEFARITTANARRFFSIPDSPDITA